MTKTGYVHLDDRGVLEVAGEDARAFLQGLISNDVGKIAPDTAIYAAFLTPQGKYLHDFFLVELGGALLLDCEKERLADLKRRLGMYRLRSKVTLTDRTDDFAVAALIGDGVADSVGLPDGPAGAAVPFAGGVAYLDPRLAAMGVRLMVPGDGAPTALAGTGLAALGAADYDRCRIRLGLPDGSRDMETERAILLENGFDELHGVDWEKGCYLGQELTARTKYRALIKKRLVPVDVDGPLPPLGTPVVFEGKEIGEIRSGSGDVAVALIRLTALEKAARTDAAFTAGDASVKPTIPAWAVLQKSRMSVRRSRRLSLSGCAS